MMKASRKPRFVLVDPSFTSHEGDRWQYAVDCARSSDELGYEFVLLTHRRAPSIRHHVSFPIKQWGIFDHAFYEHGAIFSRHKAFQQPPEQRRQNARLKERLAAIDAQVEKARSRSDLIKVNALERSRKSIITFAIVKSRLLGYGWWRRRTQNHRPFNRDDFAISLALAVKKLSLGPADRIFFHTMTYGMMESLSEVTAALGHSPPLPATAYFLFHFGAHASDARTYLDRYYGYSAYGSIAERMRVGSPFARLHFLATSEGLRAEAEAILGAPVCLARPSGHAPNCRGCRLA